MNKYCNTYTYAAVRLFWGLIGFSSITTSTQQHIIYLQRNISLLFLFNFIFSNSIFLMCVFHLIFTFYFISALFQLLKMIYKSFSFYLQQ